MRTIGFILAAGALVACGAPAGFELNNCGTAGRDVCHEIPADDPAGLLEVVNQLEGGEAVILGAGTFTLDSQVTIRASRIALLGQGPDATILDFAGQAAQSNGVDIVGDDIEVAHFTIQDAKKDGLRVEDSARVHLHHLRATWTEEESSDNGAYGLYPVRARDVLLERCEAFNSSDAGIYVGQTERAIIRDNLARGNVAGIEIENSQFVDVYGNVAEDNTAGLLIFDLPGNPIVGRDVRVYDNVVRNNNTSNFAAPGTTVAQVPAGTGTFVMASRRVEIFDNTYQNNDTMDLAIVSGLVLTEGELDPWVLQRADLRGVSPSDLPLLQTSTLVANFQTADVYVHDNDFAGGSGDGPDGLNQFGLLFSLVYGAQRIDNILYDAIGEGSFSADSAAGNTNDNHICLRSNDGATFASLNLAVLGADPFNARLVKLYRPAAPFAPFDCGGLRTGPIEPVELAPVRVR